MAGQNQAEALGQAWLAFGLTVYSEPQARYGKVNGQCLGPTRPVA